MSGSIESPQITGEKCPLFSVIIPVHNRVHLLERALRSVELQRCQDYEVIVVDDGSHEDIYETTTRGRPERFRYVRQENRGPGAARNLGVRHARGEYVAFLDSDDLWFSWTLEVYENVISRANRPGFICGCVHTFCNEGAAPNVQERAVTYIAHQDYFSAWCEPIAHGILGCSVVVNRAAFAATDGFLEGLLTAEDSDLWLNLGTLPGFVQITAPVTTAYQEAALDDANVSRRSEWIYRGIKRILLKEIAGQYPGGDCRLRERREIVCNHIRGASLSCIRYKNVGDGWWLYHRSFGRQLASGRLRYLVAFPLLAFFYSVKRCLIPPSDFHSWSGR